MIRSDEVPENSELLRPVDCDGCPSALLSNLYNIVKKTAIIKNQLIKAN